MSGREELADVLAAAPDHGGWCAGVDRDGYLDMADAVLASTWLSSVVAAEVKHWKDHAEEAGRGFAQVCRDFARVSARNVELVAALEAVAAERAEDRARLAAVEAVVWNWEDGQGDLGNDTFPIRAAAREIRAALAPTAAHDDGP